MKYYIPTLFTLSLFLISCSEYDIEPIAHLSNSVENISLEMADNVVSINDVIDIVNNEYSDTKSTGTSQFDILPYIGENSDTLLFIVNYKSNNGWKIFSTDKRTPAVVAEGKSGYFSLEDGSPAVAIWIGRISEDIAKIKQSPDSELNFSEREIQLNKAFWSGKQPNIVSQRSSEYVLGHWEETISVTNEIFDQVDHLVAEWDQAYPYNECCPYLTSNSSNRAVAGCVAIAGSQMLLYLHDKIGLPVTMYSQGVCVGDVNNYTQSFSNPTSTVWSQMSTSYQSSASSMLPEAIMIGSVGLNVNMHYWDWDPLLGYFSWALPGNLKTEVFESNGIDCLRGSYDEDIVRSSLLTDEMPIIVSASNMRIPVDFKIHCFVIDGYTRTRQKTTHWYHYVYDGPHSGPIPMPPDDYVTYSYSAPYLTSIKINWGWSSQWGDTPVNDGDYSLTAGWTVTNGGSEYDYDRHINMTYGFTAAD